MYKCFLWALCEMIRGNGLCGVAGKARLLTVAMTQILLDLLPRQHSTCSIWPSWPVGGAILFQNAIALDGFFAETLIDVHNLKSSSDNCGLGEIFILG